MEFDVPWFPRIGNIPQIALPPSGALTSAIEELQPQPEECLLTPRFPSRLSWRTQCFVPRFTLARAKGTLRWMCSRVSVAASPRR